MFRSLATGLLLLPLSLMPSAGAAEFNIDGDHCQMTVNHDLQVSPTRLLITEQQQALYRFEDGNLYVDGQQVALTEQQRQQLQQFQQQLLDGSAELVSLVNDAMMLAADVISELMREFNMSNDQPQQWMAALQQHIDQGMTVNDDGYQINSQQLSETGDQLGDAIATEVEQAVTAGVGQLLKSLGEAISSGEGDFEQRIESFAQSMEQMGERIEQQVESRSQGLEQQGERLCDRWLEIDRQEQQLHQLVPQLKPYQLITATDNEIAWLR